VALASKTTDLDHVVLKHIPAVVKCIVAIHPTAKVSEWCPHSRHPWRTVCTGI